MLEELKQIETALHNCRNVLNLAIDRDLFGDESSETEDSQEEAQTVCDMADEALPLIESLSYINLNDQFRIALTEHGQSVYEQATGQVPSKDENGHTKISLWEFASVFGPEFYMSNINQSIVDNRLHFL